MTSVGIVQTIIPHYRLPVFADLAARDGIDLTLYAQLGTDQGSLKAMGEVDDYATVNVTERTLGPFIWDPGTLKAARARHDVLICSPGRHGPCFCPGQSGLPAGRDPRWWSGGMDSARPIPR